MAIGNKRRSTSGRRATRSTAKGGILIALCGVLAAAACGTTAPRTSDPTGAAPGSGAVKNGPVTGKDCNIASTGPGWDAKNVYIGEAVATDTAKVGQSVGNPLDFGDQKAIVGAAWDALNEAGGLCGRTVKPVYYDVNSVNDPNTEAQAACTKWSQDQRVIRASLVPNINLPNMYACMSKAHIPIVAATGEPSLLAGLAPYQPYVFLRNTAPWDVFARFWVDRLVAMGYLKGWNAATGTSGTAPVKVGILTRDDPIANAAWARLKTQLERRHVEVVDYVKSNDFAHVSNYVVQFRRDGVTHVFLDRLMGLFYGPAATSQNYYPRQALNSLDFIQPFLAKGPAPRQLRGAMGVGWLPMIDVAQAQDPGPTAGYAQCMQIMHKAGVDVSRRNYQYTATAACDSAELLKRSVLAGGGFSPQQLSAGVDAAANAMPWANEFGAGARSGDPELLSTARDLEYNDSCSCIRYINGNLPIS